MPKRATIKGILRDPAGKPIADAIIMIVSGTQEFNEIASLSNKKGEFSISSIVVPGTYTLQNPKPATAQKKKESRYSIRTNCPEYYV